MQMKALCSFKMSDNYPGNTVSNPRCSEPFTDSLAKCVHSETGRYQYNSMILNLSYGPTLLSVLLDGYG